MATTITVTVTVTVRVVVVSTFSVSDDPDIEVGDGYSDGSMRQIVRTSSGYLYTVVPNCDSYPDFSANGLTQTIRVSKGYVTGTPASFARKDSGNEPAAVVGCSAALDGSDNIHIAWSARSASNLTRYLRYAVFNTGTDTWGSVTTILSNLDYDDIGQGDENTAIAIDANGKAHVVFLTTVGSGTLADRRIYYTNNVSGSWAAAARVDSDVSYSTNYKAWHPGIAFDTSGRIAVTWLSGTFNDNDNGTVYVRTRETNGTWNDSVSILGSVHTGIDQCVSLLITSDNRYHLGFSGAKSSGWQPIKYYYSDNNGVDWTANNPSVSQTHNVTTSLGDSGGIRLWHHGTGDPVNIYYVQGAGGAAEWGAATLFASGEYDCTINALSLIHI